MTVDIAAMAVLYRSARLVILYVVGLFWSLGVSLQVVRLLVTKPRKFLYSKDRKCAPYALQDPDLGSHGYAIVNVSLFYYSIRNIPLGGDPKTERILSLGL